jgi:putative transposase
MKEGEPLRGSRRHGWMSPLLGLEFAMGMDTRAEVELTFFDPRGEIDHSQNRLPHWEQKGATYFVTFRLADALPADLMRAWAEERTRWMEWHPEPWTAEVEREYHERFSSAIERMADQGHGECLLKDPETSTLVGNALMRFDNERCDQVAWVVMPNHVHAVFGLRSPWTLKKLLQSWKGFTARALNKMHGRSGDVWQRDYYDRLVRDERHFANVVRYIRNNPGKACLKAGEFLHWESPMARGIE